VGDVLRCDVRSGLCLSMLDASRDGIGRRVDIFDTRVGSRAGESVISLGDVDRDGIDDYAVGGPTGNARMVSECGWVRVVSGADNETLGVSNWNYSKQSEVPSTYCGFGGRMSLVRVLRQGTPCSLLAVSSSRSSMARGVVFFDLARVARGGAMVEGAVWEATQAATWLDVRSLANE
jgi:hypothetical protein